MISRLSGVQTEFFRLGHVAREPVRRGQFAEAMRGFLDRGRVDDALRAGGERPFVRPVVDELAGLAVLVERDLRDIVFVEIPDAPVAELPARSTGSGRRLKSSGVMA